MEAKIRNSGETISPMFLAAHFLEKAGLPDTTKQSILTMVKLEEKKTVLTQIKKAFETLVANFDKEDEANTSFWGQSHYGRGYSRRDDYDRRIGENGRYKERGRQYDRRDSRDERQDRNREEGYRRRHKDRRIEEIETERVKPEEEAVPGSPEEEELAPKDQEEANPEDQEEVPKDQENHQEDQETSQGTRSTPARGS